MEYCERLDGIRCLLLGEQILPHDEFEADRVPMASNSKEVDPEFERLASARKTRERQAVEAERHAKSKQRLALRRRMEAEG